VPESSRPRLIVCTTCRAGRDLAEGDTPDGALLFSAVAGLLAGGGGSAELRGATCMANCERGCSAALAMPGKWTFFLGNLRPDQAADLLSYAETYAASATGTVMPARRPASLRNIVLGRVPPQEFAA
jgi:predicted metal-binding protein